MTMWGKLMTALRGGVHETGEALMDSQALRILEQEIREATAEVQRAKDSLVEVMAQQKLAEGRAGQVAEKIMEYEGYALQALDKDEETLAHEVAARIAALEAEKGEHDALAGQYRHAVRALQATIQESEQHLRRIRQQADTVKATAHVQKAQAAVAERFGSSQSKMHNAMESLARIRERQMEDAMRLEVSGELARAGSDAALEAKLRDAGIGGKGNTDTQAILERLKAKK
ncbi:MAG: PspA/IM30 family protein [Cardiobacteriaceae bacterium]|nr:PspA/IM30 family protein [Cardiobacteriaceae bacterium]